MKTIFKILFLISIGILQANAQGFDGMDDTSTGLPIKQTGEKGEKSISNFPRHKDLTANLDLQIVDQGKAHSCLAISICYYAYSIQRAQLDRASNATGRAQSAMYPYLSIRKNSCSSGLRIDSLRNFLLNNGNLAYNQFTTNNCNERITAQHKRAAKKNKSINDIIVIFDKRDLNVPKKSNDQIREAVKEEIFRNQRPVVFAMNLYNNLRKLSPNDEFYYPNQGDRRGTDGHAMTVVGYDDSLKAFKILNSWGEEFGQGGYFWMKYSDFAAEAIKGFVLNLPDEKPSSSDQKLPVKMGGKFGFLHENQTISKFEETEIPFHTGAGLYELNKKNWKVGQLFQLTTTNSNSGQSICVFSIDKNNTLSLHWPNIELISGSKSNDDDLGMSISDQMPNRNHTMYIPNEEDALRIDYAGTDYLCVLYSEKSLMKDIKNIINRINSKPDQNIVERIQFGLGERLIKPSDINYQKTGMSFSTNTLSGDTVPIILKIQSVNN